MTGDINIPSTFLLPAAILFSGCGRHPTIIYGATTSGAILTAVIAALALAACVVIIRKIRYHRQSYMERHLREALRISNRTIAEERKRYSDEIALLREMLAEARTTRHISEMEPTLHDTRTRMQQLYKERWYLLNTLCKELYDRNAVPCNTKLENIGRELNKLKNPEFIENLELQINRDFDGLATRLREQCHMLPKEDITFCIMTFAGMPASAIAWSTDSVIPSVYVRRQRIKTRIIRSNAPDKERFIYFFTS